MKMSKHAGLYHRVPSVKHNTERMESGCGGLERTEVNIPAAVDLVGGTVLMRNAQCDLLGCI
jgi:hypothetical protein